MFIALGFSKGYSADIAICILIFLQEKFSICLETSGALSLFSSSCGLCLLAVLCSSAGRTNGTLRFQPLLSRMEAGVEGGSDFQTWRCCCPGRPEFL